MSGRKSNGRSPFKIIACVIWYDESPEDLTRMARSLVGFADGMVALDGAFATFPLGRDATPWSGSDQVTALVDACQGDIELMLYQPTAPGTWPGALGNEVEKRNASLRLAGMMGATWVFNCDADMFLESHGDARERMEATSRDVVWDDVEGMPTKHVYRYSRRLRHWRSHWIVINERGMLSGPRDRNRGLGGYPKLLTPLDLRDTLQFAHPEKGDYWRRVRQKAWYDYRDGPAALERW